MEGLRLLTKGKAEMKPLLLRSGIALALSLAGYLLIQYRSRKIIGSARCLQPLHPPGKLNDGRKTAGGQLEEFPGEKYEKSSPKLSKEAKTSTVAESSAINITDIDNNEYLSPESNKLTDKKFDYSFKRPGIQSTQISTEGLLNEELVLMEQEICKLNDQVKLLQERERILEFQLLEYYGFKEQETAVRDLENSLKFNSMEVKLLNFKIETLQADNRRLKAQVSDSLRLISELETARAKVKHLKKKQRSDSELAKEKAAALHHRILALQEIERANQKNKEDIDEKLTRFNELEDEARDLRKANSRLILENVELNNKLETCQIIAIDFLENAQANEALDELNRLKQRNEELIKEIEQLQNDRCADVEELVYLRWINACLRHEMRNYQPPVGKTVARDLSQTSSPKSEEKAKQLILEYAEVRNDEVVAMEFDSQYSSSPSSSQTEIHDADDSSTITKSSSSSRKSKLLRKLQQLVLGKQLHRKRSSSSDSTTLSNSERTECNSNCSFDDVIRRNSVDSISSSLNGDHESGDRFVSHEAPKQRQIKARLSESMSTRSFDSQLLSPLASESSELSRYRSGNESGGYRRFILQQQSAESSPRTVQTTHDFVDSPEKAALKKFARALNDAR